MKKGNLIIGLILLIVVSATSCKKDRTCVCTTTWFSYNSGNYYSGSSTDTKTIEKVTKRQAEAGECASGKQHQTTVGSADFYDSETECELK